MLNTDPSNMLAREMHQYKPCIRAGLSVLSTIDRLMDCPVKEVLDKYPEIHEDIIQRIRLIGVSKILATPSYHVDDYAQEIDKILKANGGNWIELIFDRKSVDKVYHHQVRIFLYQAVYHYNLKITKEPLFAFRNTIQHRSEIDRFVDSFDYVDETYCNRVVFTTERSLCQLARELVDTGMIVGSLRFIEKLKPILRVS